MTQNEYDTGLDLDQFKAAMSDMPTAVNVITCLDAKGRPLGSTLSAVSSLSLDPPMMLACFDTGSNTLKSLKPGTDFLIHVLSEGQEGLAYTMAGKGADKFENIDLADDGSSLPKLSGCAAVLKCTVGQHVAGGDHIIVLGNVSSAERNDVSPLVYHRRSLFPLRAKEDAK